MLVFALLVGAALRFRRRSDIHKRLMLLGCVGLLTAAIARIPLTLLREGGIVAAFLTTLALVLACVAWDTIAQRRLHPAFAWGAGLIRSEKHTSALQSLMRNSYAVFCLKKKTQI